MGKLIVETKYFDSKAPLKLECGKTLDGVTIAYETYGSLNKDKSNCVYIFHALSGDSHVAGYHSQEDKKPGWWDYIIGDGRPIDTKKFFVVCANVLGGCKGTSGPSSINPKTNKPYALDFPVITIKDMVNVHKLLLDYLGIKKVYCSIGGSMGGMQEIEFLSSYPKMSERAIIIGASLRQSPQSIAFHAVGRQAIMKDLQWNRGAYYSSSQPAYGLSVARMLSHISYMSQASLWEKFGRKLQNKKALEYGFGNEFEVESYLNHQGESFTQRFDANSYLYITRAIDYFDISRDKKNAYSAFENTDTKCLVISISSDWLYPPSESVEIVDALRYNNIDTSYFEFQSDKGHDAFLIPDKNFEELIGGFLKNKSLKKKTPVSLKFHHKLVFDQIDKNSRVLDLGCGEGEVLLALINEKNCFGFGIDIDSKMVAKCIEKGVSAVQSNMEESLPKYKEKSFDYVIIDETLQTVKNSVDVLNQAARVGKKVIVTFPNFAHIDVRSYLVLKGRMPMSKELPYAWYNTPNIHLFTIKDFEELCRQNSFTIIRKVYYDKSKKAFVNANKPNLLAKNALFVIEKRK